MGYVLSAAQMRSLEQGEIESGRVSGICLMERAGAGVVRAVLAKWPELEASDRGASPSGSPGYLQQEERGAWCAMILCGPGNNGGDGFVVARLLKARGWHVEVFIFGQAECLPPDAALAFVRWVEVGAVQDWDEAAIAARTGHVDLVVDAVFGTGLSRPLPAALDRGRLGIETGVRRVAIDLPSGLCSDSGKDMGAWPAHLSVSFHTAKPGHLLTSHTGPHGGAGASGDLCVVDIGLPERDVPGAVELVMRAPAALAPKGAGHKFTHGHALVLTGGFGRSGAARLAARAALRIGAGLVTLGVPPAARLEVAAQISALMMQRMSGRGDLEELLQDARINALCLGPGFGYTERQQVLVETALCSGRPIVLDADALTLLAQDADLRALLHEGCVLTPHGGEFARLFPQISARLQAPAERGPAYSKLDATRDAAAALGCTVVFKGEDTVIADQTGRCALNAAVRDRATPVLATAGSGDVLAGMITGLLARGSDPFEAAKASVWAHCEAARQFGPGLIAEDLPEMLPAVLRGI